MMKNKLTEIKDDVNIRREKLSCSGEAMGRSL